MKTAEGISGIGRDELQPGGSHSAPPVVFEARLVEEAVALALRQSPADPFWKSREEVYAETCDEERERRFELLNGQTFERLRLGAPVRAALDEQPILASRVKTCFVAGAVAGGEEGAELFVTEGREDRSVLIRLRATTLGATEKLLALLRHEIFHIADMVDPAFAYDPALPEVDGGAVRLRLALDRYRVLWDTAIDGRLVRRGHLEPSALESRRRQFDAAFRMLRERTHDCFTRWGLETIPRHPDLLRYALDPAAEAGLAADRPAAIGVCPVCHCAAHADALQAAAISPAIMEELRLEFPAWQAEDGICRRCVELYEARPLSRHAAGVLPS
ncbi:MAG TPA: hypothetical protein VMT52_15020 [Planctomycetota bacterium]|nr:hypothetical protein [Planctomycetota bacterium]